MDDQCKICNSLLSKEINIAIEVRQKTNEEFIYLKCDTCGCVQIGQIPTNIEKYYNNYYSLNGIEKSKQIISFLRKSVFKFRLNNKNILGLLITMINPNMFFWMEKKMFDFNSKILDIGCGNGSLLVKMAESGFVNLTGVDLFINNDITYFIDQTEIKVLKKNFSDLSEKYDLIMLHHVLEHIPDQHDFFKNIKKIMHKETKILFVLPIISDTIWDIYGIKGFQFEDAPRHFYIHSKKSLLLLFELYGLKIIKMKSFFEDKVLNNIYNNSIIDNPKKIKKSILNKQDTGLMVYYLTLN